LQESLDDSTRRLLGERVTPEAEKMFFVSCKQPLEQLLLATERLVQARLGQPDQQADR
jgi:hypothetical protein